ncbi:MAG: clostripain-related cysteine peptidase [Chloroflexota bacterium]
MTLPILACGVFGSSPPQMTPTAVSTPTALPTTISQATQPPTARPTLPPPTETPPPQPTPTYDPGLADWTVLIYLDADNNLEQAGLLDLQEMEAAGQSAQVNVLVQMDRAIGETAVADNWTSTRRYRIVGDSDPNTISSELLVELGERNMGDPNELAEFISWGVQTYPANRYALVIWDHGAGWNGIAFDSDGGETGPSGDHITLQDLRVAMDTALTNSNIDKLDVVGFDACLMGQLDVFHALQPFAEFGVGSEELTPGLGWDYTTLLGHLYTNTSMDGAQLSRQMVTDFINYYTEVEPDQFVTMSAVDLRQLPILTQAVNQLAERITAVPNVVASAIGDARSGAESFARVYANEYEQYASIDLHHFASILSQRSPDPEVNAAAQQVMSAVEQVVFAHEQGNAFEHSAGIAVYFPRNDQFYDPAYPQMSGLQGWDQLLNSYYDVGFSALPQPDLEINNVLRDVVSVQNPAFVDFEIIGREIENVVVLASQLEEDGRLRLVEYDNLIPEPTLLADGSEIVEWRDGIHEDFFVWNTLVTYLFDAEENGDFVVMWPTEFGSSLFTVQGTFQRADTGEQFSANLVFDHDTGQLTRIWSYQSEDKAGVAELFAQPGDSFQMATFYIDTNQQISPEPGPTLVFDNQGKLYFDRRPLPSGSYQFGLQAENVAGMIDEAFVDLTVENETFTSGYNAYLDPYLGFQFLYPATWYTPIYADTLLYTSQRDGTQQFQLTLYPNLETAVDLQTLRAQVLSQFGPVDILFEEEILVSGIPGLQSAYGYQKADGSERTGVFFLFIQDETGFVIDLDAPIEEESLTLDTIRQMVSSWQFADANFNTAPGRWSTIQFDTFEVAQPADFVYSEFNEWQRFSSGQHIFVALRAQPLEGTSASTLAKLVTDAGSGVQNFVSEESYRFGLGEHIWDRVDFAYTATDGTNLWGYIMLRIENGQAVVAWAEAPTTVYNELETAVFLTMIADLDAK